MYRVPDDVLATLDERPRAAVIAIANSANGIHLLHLPDTADKPALLTALADTAVASRHRALALPASTAAAEYHTTHRYADTPTPGVDDLRTLTPGTLLIVDDADHLTAKQLTQLAANAAHTNTKVVLATSDTAGPGSNLTAAAQHHLPWAQHLGTPGPDHHRQPTAIDRAETHLATTGGHSPARTDAAALLARRDELLHSYTTTTAARNLGEDLSTQHSRDHGLDL
jgi:hypothetical protein